VVKRAQRIVPVKPVRKEEPKPSAWPTELHSGEGAASVMDTLQKMEKRRGAAKPRDPAP
jgi:hypothetical protein